MSLNPTAAPRFSTTLLPQTAVPVARPAGSVQIPRSLLWPGLLLPPLLLAGVSWVMDGVPFFTDLSMLGLIGVVFAVFINELWMFRRRLGVGMLTLMGGVLIWFCYDYLRFHFSIFLLPFSEVINPDSHFGIALGYDAGTIAKAAFLHILAVLCMILGFHIPTGRWLPDKLARLVPEPHQPGTLLWIAVALALICVIIPFGFFTNEGFFQAIYHHITGGYGGSADWTVGRTGNTNYEWGAYIAHFFNIGAVASILAVYCAMSRRANPFALLMAWGSWGLWTAINFGSGARGKVVMMTLPICIFLFLWLQISARHHGGKRKLVLSYVVPATLLFGTLVFAQIAANQRNRGFTDIDTSNLSLTRLEGNAMFSTPLAGLELIPAEREPFYSHWPGEEIITVLPRTAVEWVIHFVPRAAWPSKPIDPVFLWYNELITGEDGADRGTSISHGYVGGWYFRYGVWGLIQGSLAFGFVALLLEKLLRMTWGRVLSTMLVLAYLVGMFRLFRGVNPIPMVPAILATIFFAVLMRILRVLKF